MLTNSTKLQTSEGVQRTLPVVKAPSTASRLVDSVVNSTAQQEPPVLTKVAQAVSTLFAPSAKEGAPVANLSITAASKVVAQPIKASSSSIATTKAPILQEATITSGSDMTASNLTKASAVLNAAAAAPTAQKVVSVVKPVPAPSIWASVVAAVTEKVQTVPAVAPVPIVPTNPTMTLPQTTKVPYLITPVKLQQVDPGYQISPSLVPAKLLDTGGSGTELLLEDGEQYPPLPVEATPPPVQELPAATGSTLVAYIVGGGVGAAIGAIAASMLKKPTKTYALAGLAIGAIGTYLLKSRQAV